jgi:hypothetical protein
MTVLKTVPSQILGTSPRMTAKAKPLPIIPDKTLNRSQVPSFSKARFATTSG